LRSDIDQILVEKGAKALLLVSESFKDVNMYYLTKFLAPDPFMLLKKVDSPPTILVSAMEFERAKKESMVKDVRCYADYNYFNIVKAEKEPQVGVMKFYATVVEREIGKKSVIAVPQSFSALLLDFLRSEGFNVKPFYNLVEKARETKEPDEISEMVAVQRVTEKATSEVIETISNCAIDSDRTLTYKKGRKKQPLTAGKLKSLIGHAFIEHQIITEDTIVACGPKSAMPHYTGEPDDLLKTNQPIIIDVFPQSLRKRYGTDMTRTLVKGKAPKEIKKMFEVVLKARNACLDALHEGVLGSDMYNLCCDVFEKAGYQTARGGKQIEKGFTHGLGHGVGLAVHEAPSMNELFKFPLKEHVVVTVEPGLYDPKIGGVRIEDIVEVTKKGCRNLTKMPIQLEI
jgi:Xaa-Pro aminopeptidase